MSKLAVTTGIRKEGNYSAQVKCDRVQPITKATTSVQIHDVVRLEYDSIGHALNFEVDNNQLVFESEASKNKALARSFSSGFLDDSKFDDGPVSWEDIRVQLRTSNIRFIKDVILSGKIGINDRDDIGDYYDQEMTLLMWCSLFGAYDMVELLIVYGADINLKSKKGRTALDIANEFGNNNVSKLLMLSELGSAVAADIEEMVAIIKEKEGIAAFIMENMSTDEIEKLVDVAIKSVKDKAVLSQDLLLIAWQYTIKQYPGVQIFESPLYKQLYESFVSVVSDTNLALEWHWMKLYFWKLYILYYEVPKPYINPEIIEMTENDSKEDESSEFEHKGHKEIYRLCNVFLEIAKIEMEKQSKSYLVQELTLMKDNNQNLWDDLIKFGSKDAPRKYKKIVARQDSIKNGVRAQYTQNEITMQKPLYSSFNPVTFYDRGNYLNDLMLRSSQLNDLFQDSMEAIVNKMRDNKEDSIKVSFSKGPMKTTQRSNEKVANHYYTQAYPTAAHLLDILRCMITFEDLPGLMKGLDIIEDEINSGNYAINQIIRVKNDWNYFDMSSPGYADIKYNVIVGSNVLGTNIAVIAEVQVLLRLMNNFKKEISHPLYNVTRTEEYVENFNKASEMLSDNEHILFTIAANGDKKGLMQYRLNMNNNMEKILFTNDKNQTLFALVCKLDKIGLLKLLQKWMEPERFRQELIRLELSKSKYTPLGRALNANSEGVVKFLCKYYFDLILEFEYAKDGLHLQKRGIHALHFGILYDNKDIWYAHEKYIKEKLDSHATYTKENIISLLCHQNVNQNTPLHWCVWKSRFEYMNLIMKSEVSQSIINDMVEIKNANHETVLIFAATLNDSEKNINIIREYLKNVEELGSDEMKISAIFAKTKEGNNAAMVAAAKGFIGIVKLLVEIVNDKHLKISLLKNEMNQASQNLLEIAQINNHFQVADWVKEELAKLDKY